MNVQSISERIKALKRENKTLFVAIEGYGGSGKSTLAGELKRIMPNSEVIKIDSFIIKEKAQKGEPWEEVFDRKRLEKQVLEPARLGLVSSYQMLDWAKNEFGPSIKLPKVDYLIIDGISSYHPDIEHYYDFKIWVEAPLEVAKIRGQLRDKGSENEKLWEKWAKCDLAYQQQYHPEERADFIFENNGNETS